MAKKGTVLVVDDEPLIVELLVDALESEGYQVAASVNGETMQLACTLRPDLILLDIMMPGMDGVEVSRRLHDDPRTAHIPVIALSAAHNLRTYAAAMPIDDYLAKPFDIGELLARVDKWAAPQHVDAESS